MKKSIALTLIFIVSFSVAQVHVNVNINQPYALVINAGDDVTLCSGSGDTLHATGGTTYTWSPSYGLSCTNCSAPYAKPNTTTTYIVRGTNEYGCTAWDTIVVTVAPSLVANAGHDTSICNGKSTMLHASGGTNYSWSPSTGLSSTSAPNPIASPQVTTTYTVIVSSGECTPAKDSVMVMVLPNPPIPAITRSGTTLHSSSPTGNQWYINGFLIVGATAQDYTATQNGNYSVVVTGSNGCSSTSDSMNVIVGIEESKEWRSKSMFTLFPNPNNGTFTVVFDANQIADYDIELRDILGRVVHQEHLEKFIGRYSQQFDLSVYPKGFYSLSLRNGKEIMVRKVVTY